MTSPAQTSGVFAPRRPPRMDTWVGEVWRRHQDPLTSPCCAGVKQRGYPRALQGRGGPMRGAGLQPKGFGARTEAHEAVRRHQSARKRCRCDKKYPLARGDHVKN
ncbi:hypothetical protein NDU88_006812 [Pleurodeles waltl]|uniref:Uncharacterized protein n=1 Tax=Pleurodeles waltl TaxID=8319 RepID=A0AAV7WF97_PLEWA|nr:hypothetical protein NDU88_006812 [Pleurodeles waltl]